MSAAAKLGLAAGLALAGSSCTLLGDGAGWASVWGRVEVGLQIDPLDALPRLLKMVYPFDRSPRHAWANGVANLALKSDTGETVHRIEGAGIASIVHLDSSPR